MTLYLDPMAMDFAALAFALPLFLKAVFHVAEARGRG